MAELNEIIHQPVRLRAVSGYGLEIVEWLPVGDLESPATLPPGAEVR